MDTGVWEVSAALVKALTYAASLGAAGLALFHVYGAPLGVTVHDLRRPVVSLAGAALLLTVVKWPLLAGALSGAAGMQDPAMLRMIIGGGEGMAGLLRASGLAVLCIGMLGPRGKRVLLVTGVLLVAISFATLGHVHALHRLALSGVLVLHLVGAAFWLGALWPLGRLLARDPRRAAPVVARFSRLAVVAVPLLLVAGACLLVALLDAPSALLTTGYGRWMCVKLTLVAGLLGLAARNRLRLTARLGRPGGEVALLRAIHAEMLLAAGVLAVTAVMTTLTGPGD